MGARSFQIILTVLSMLLIAASVSVAADYYVDASSGTDDSGGGSQSSPFKTISFALGYATAAGDNIHIAAGDYNEALGESFPLEMNYNVNLLGAGSDAVTIDAGNSAAHVISCIGDGNLILRGLKVTGGSAGAATAYTTDAFGGGILIWNCSPTIEGCNITENEAVGESAGAAGIACVGFLWGTSSPTIRDCVISHNTVRTTGPDDGAGGGIGCIAVYWGTCNALIQDCVIADNYAEAEHSSGSVAGGGIGCAIATSNDTCSAEILNCLVINNGLSAPVYAHGGGIYGHLADMTMSQCTVANNYPDGVNVSGNSSVLLNSIIWNNDDDIVDLNCSQISHCDISDGTCEGQYGNISQDPRFTYLPAGCRYNGYFLYYANDNDKSPCINAGDTAFETYGDTGNEKYSTDIDGYLDMTDGDKVDMGYHYKYGGPAFIQLRSFWARGGFDEILVSWETGTEIDNAGFLLYRADDHSSGYNLVSGFIPSDGSPAGGASYSHTDEDVLHGVSYTYWLIDIDASGKWTAHGPSSATLARAFELTDSPVKPN
ncbi:MAG: DUF1565 domain-containing protein [Candidatus Coatesbacteria bacterium]|nr:DUF1565 domain-containing protein [Candidatus Coatesbacteria bacterium]